jgi:hypothetical protein
MNALLHKRLLSNTIVGKQLDEFKDKKALNIYTVIGVDVDDKNDGKIYVAKPKTCIVAVKNGFIVRIITVG